MFAMLDVVIGVVFVYLTLAALVAGINECVAGLLRLRGTTLRRAVTRLVEQPLATDAATSRVLVQPQPRVPGERTRAFYAHPRIAALTNGKRPPSYIPSDVFASVAWDIEHPATMPSSKDPSSPVENVMATSPTGFRPPREMAALETLFNETMDRATGWYKRQAQILTLVVGSVVVVVSNADTIQIANILWTTPTLRAVVVEEAARRAQGPRPGPALLDAAYPGEDPMPDEDVGNAEDLADTRPADGAAAGCASASSLMCDTLDKLMGWGPDYKRFNTDHCVALEIKRNDICANADREAECRQLLDGIFRDGRCVSESGRLSGTTTSPGWGFLSASMVPIATGHLLGWILTLAAISLGAPFWFDMLKSYINIRSGGNPPKKDTKDSALLTPSSPTPARADGVPRPDDNEGGQP